MNETEKAIKMLIEKKLTISTSESCTGGMLASELISCSGASECFKNGFITYSNEAKIRFINVKKETLEAKGAVSEETAKEMAENTARISGTDIALSTTGIAGPSGGSAEKPVGLVYCGLCFKGKTEAFKFNFKGNRQEIRQAATQAAVKILCKKIKEDL